MAEFNKGNQSIVYKYRTPLIASQLATAFGHYTTAGLCDIQCSVVDTTFTVKKFSLVVKALGDGEPNVDVNESMFRITGNTSFSFTGLGESYYSGDKLFLIFSYAFTGSEGRNRKLMDSWFGDFELVNETKLGEMLNNGFDNRYILGTLIKETTQSDTNGLSELEEIVKYRWTTNGADWSGIVLEEKGLNPKLWLSTSSPRRHSKQIVGEEGVVNYKNDFDDWLEIRCGNELFDSYFVMPVNNSPIVIEPEEYTWVTDDESVVKSSTYEFWLANNDPSMPHISDSSTEPLVVCVSKTDANTYGLTISSEQDYFLPIGIIAPYQSKAEIIFNDNMKPIHALSISHDVVKQANTIEHNMLNDLTIKVCTKATKGSDPNTIYFVTDD